MFIYSGTEELEHLIRFLSAKRNIHNYGLETRIEANKKLEYVSKAFDIQISEILRGVASECLSFLLQNKEEKDEIGKKVLDAKVKADSVGKLILGIYRKTPITEKQLNADLKLAKGYADEILEILLRRGGNQ